MTRVRGGGEPVTWTVDVYETDDGRCPYATFSDNLDEAARSALDAAVEYVLKPSGIDLAGTEWLKALGQGLYEFRVRHDADEIRSRFASEDPTVAPKHASILLRVFCTFHGAKIVLLLSGYDKGADDSAKRQQREIAAARKLFTSWREEQARAKAQRRKRR